MKILGIDPGTATTGYGFIEKNGEGYEFVEFGLIQTAKEELPERRLNSIYKEMLSIIKLYNPDIIAIERLFFATNVKTAMSVSQAKGVIMLAAARRNVKIVEFTPMEVKKTIAGSGNAKKDAMKSTVRKILKVRSKKKQKTHFDDAADALAIALCYFERQ